MNATNSIMDPAKIHYVKIQIIIVIIPNNSKPSQRPLVTFYIPCVFSYILCRLGWLFISEIHFFKQVELQRSLMSC